MRIARSYMNKSYIRKDRRVNLRIESANIEQGEDRLNRVDAQAPRFEEIPEKRLPRTLKVARTIADLAGEEEITPAHLNEAIQCRAMDRYY
jgi:predicted ATPase with chaperone activity